MKRAADVQVDRFRARPNQGRPRGWNADFSDLPMHDMELCMTGLGFQQSGLAFYTSTWQRHWNWYEPTGVEGDVRIARATAVHRYDGTQVKLRLHVTVPNITVRPMPPTPEGKQRVAYLTVHDLPKLYVIRDTARLLEVVRLLYDTHIHRQRLMTEDLRVVKVHDELQISFLD